MHEEYVYIHVRVRYGARPKSLVPIPSSVCVEKKTKREKLVCSIASSQHRASLKYTRKHELESSKSRVLKQDGPFSPYHTKSLYPAIRTRTGVQREAREEKQNSVTRLHLSVKPGTESTVGRV
ncbi:uncharacterized protein LOC143177363 [Calliopsis andreniformis]|uniref:uncharacterized protein LOC143177363 n=1 Tax=Calliopsis andreniformis TaxID=337506 RepID=UPI003FCC98AB